MANETKQIAVTFKVAENGEWVYEYAYPKWMPLTANNLLMFNMNLGLAANVLKNVSHDEG